MVPMAMWLQCEIDLLDRSVGLLDPCDTPTDSYDRPADPDLELHVRRRKGTCFLLPDEEGCIDGRLQDQHHSVLFDASLINDAVLSSRVRVNVEDG